MAVLFVYRTCPSGVQEASKTKVGIDHKFELIIFPMGVRYGVWCPFKFNATQTNSNVISDVHEMSPERLITSWGYIHNRCQIDIRHHLNCSFRFQLVSDLEELNWLGKSFLTRQNKTKQFFKALFYTPVVRFFWTRQNKTKEFSKHYFTHQWSAYKSWNVKYEMLNVVTSNWQHGYNAVPFLWLNVEYVYPIHQTVLIDIEYITFYAVLFVMYGLFHFLVWNSVHCNYYRSTDRIYRH